ncbi:MAG: 1-acyl-sn-glycerol-3-phosphate acyltransferase [Clostridia bacterium]|nr:1-acyl-sn-glycerol-3-phosphate acyltransferase [Clostridia bacterium]
MKIKVAEMPYEKVLELPKEKREKPVKPGILFRTLLKTLSKPDLKATDFTYRTFGMERLGKDEPCLILMNHSSFIDLKIASVVFSDRPFNIVCTSDGFVGKKWLMRNLGCIPTQKFVTDIALVRDMKYCFDTLKTSVLMYPEASYSFDGTATPLPESVGKSLKLLKVPVVMVKTYGAFSRDPLYNNLQLRKVKVSCDVTYLLSKEDIEEKSVKELNDILKEQFTFDNFRWQQENDVSITEDFRADYLNRVLFKCPHCGTEGKMEGKGTRITCHACDAEHELTEKGFLKGVNVSEKFSHIPDWYRWEREEVKKEVEENRYSLSLPVDICLIKNTKSVYKVGSGVLTHNSEGFRLSGCDGKLEFTQKPKDSYSLYADYYWYEIGDMICIGDKDVLYYCFPKVPGDFVAKARIATEEMYKKEK